MSGTLVQSTQTSNGTAQSSMSAPSQTNTAGNVMVAIVQCNPSNNPTLTDTKGNTYTLVQGAGLYANGLKLYTAPITTGGSGNAVTATSGSFSGIWAGEVSGVTNSGCVGVGQAQNGPGNAANAITTGLGTFPGLPTFMVALSYNATGINTGNSDTGPAAGTGMTGLAGVWTANSGSGQALATPATIRFTTGTSGAATFTSTTGSDLFVTVGVQFQETATAFTLTAAQGSFAMTGEAAALNFASGVTSYTLLANMGVFNLAGAPETSNYQLDAANGYFSLTGENAALFSGAVPAYTLTAAAGSFFLTGVGAALFPTGLPTAFGTDPLPIPRAASKDWQTQSREEQAKAIRIARRLDRSRRGIKERRKPKPPREREVIDTTNVPDELKDMALAMARQQIQMMPAPVTPPPRELTDAEKRLLKFVPIMRALK